MAGLFKDRFNYESLYKLAKENWDVSMSALARYTQYASAEFAVRSFITNDEEHMMEQMAAWAKHNNVLIMRKQEASETVKYSRYPNLLSRKRERNFTQKLTPLQIQVQGSITPESIQLHLL